MDLSTDDLDDRLIAYADLLTNRPYLAGMSEHRLRERICPHLGTQPPARLLSAALTLADRGDLAGGLVSGQLAKIVIGQGNRDEAWRELVTALRGSVHFEVADAAWDIDLSVSVSD
ncbi:hypothetical protein ACFQ9X_39590 [Catenulispora yoronensis]